LDGLGIRVDGIDHDHAAVLAELSGPLPPIIVHRDTGRVIDGLHRLAAARARGDTEIDAILLDGDLPSALLSAVWLNARHGLPLKPKDRRAAAARILAAYPAWSDRRVASFVGVSAKTVASVRARSTAEFPQSNTRYGLDGRSRKEDTHAARCMAREIFVREPKATIREVARQTGLSLATVHDVRRRMSAEETSAAGPVRRVEADRSAPAPCGSESPQDAADDREHQGAPGTSPVPVTRVAGEGDPVALLNRLRADPSVRGSLHGRALLRLLSMHALSSATIEQLASAVPIHRSTVTARLARQCGEAWLRLAYEIDHRCSPEER
jgi:AraC-like DNA-binding protein